MKAKKIEAEGSELILRNEHGDYAIIPKKHRLEVQDMVKSGCHGCIDALVDTLPVMNDYAQDGSLYPEEPVINPNNPIQLKEVTIKAEAPTWVKYKQAWEKENPFDINKYVEDRFNNPVGREAIKRIDEKGWKETLKQEGLKKRERELDEATKMGLLYQRFNPQGKDDIAIADEQFSKRYGTSTHRYRYDNDPKYRKYYENVARNATSKIDYPSTDLRRKDVVAPNNMWMYPNLSGESKAQATNFSNEVIAMALPIPGLETMGKIPSVFKASKNLIKGAGKADDVVKMENAIIDANNKSWKKYITQEEKVERMLTQKDKIKAATAPENKLSLEEKLNPFKVEDTGGGADYMDIINLSKNDRRYNPGMTYDEFENAAKTWASKRRDDLAPDMGGLGSARHNMYWGISEDFKGLPKDADIVRKIAYNTYYGSATTAQKEIIKNAIKNHELDHFLYRNSRKEYDDIIKTFDPEKFGISKKYLMGRKSSIAGDEIRARMGQLMDYFEFKVNPKTGVIEDAFGNKSFTQKHLDYARKNYIIDTNLDNSMKPFFDAINDDKTFIKIMNNTALSTVPIMMYLQSQQPNKTK